MAIAANLGFPRIGIRRDLKRAVEEYWAGNLDPRNFKLRPPSCAADTGSCSGRWASNTSRRTISPSTTTCSTRRPCWERCRNDSAYSGGMVDLATYFAMARGTDEVHTPGHDEVVRYELSLHRARVRAGHEVPAGLDQAHRPFQEALALGIHTRPVLLGPLTFLLLGKCKGAKQKPLALLDDCCPSTKSCFGGWPTRGPTGCRSTSPCWPSICRRRRWTRGVGLCAAECGLGPDPGLFGHVFWRFAGQSAGRARLPVAAVHLDLVRAPSSSTVPWT